MWVRAFVFALFTFLPIFAAEAPKPLRLSEFRRELTAHIGAPRFAAATWGIKILSLDSSATLFETNAHKLLKPASNAKVFTTALALDALGPGFRIRTSLLSKSKPDVSGRLRGDLIVYGRGDPSFAARFQENSYTNLLRRVTEALRAARIKQIEGDLVGDETYFIGPRFGSSWTWDDLQYYYGAEVSALSFQDNVIDLFLRPAEVGAPCEVSVKPATPYLELINRTRTTATNTSPSIRITRTPGERRAYVTGTLPSSHGGWVDAVTVPNPALWFLTALREALQREGISVTGRLTTRSWPEHARLNINEYQEIAFTESPPMTELVAKMLKPSQNLYAQLLLLQVGAHSKAKAATTEDAGLVELRGLAERARINPREILLDEGSGLSRAALVTPEALVSLHRYMSKHPHGEAFRNALPAPGEGTLRTRFKELRASELRAKTGTVRYVNTLSGYILSGAGERLAFAVMLNAYDNDNSISAREEVDSIARLLSRLNARSE